MLIRENDGVTYSANDEACDGSDSAVMAAKRCTVPFTKFREDPFNLAWGSSIYARVYASNIMGDSLFSPAGNGAMITTVPSAPTNIEFDPALSNAVQIKVTWQTPLENGGVEILDYRIWYD